jgi:uncharacterized membrane protein YfcA
LTDSFWLLAGLCASAFAAGVINSIAGGGTLLTFPALLALLSPVTANATSTLAVFPGTVASAWAYRQSVEHPPQLLLWLLAPSAIGGLLGTWIVTSTEERVFAALIPWLILIAVTLFAVQPLVTRYAISHSGPHNELPRPRLAALAAVQFLVGVYGGYFGAGMGIMMLGALAYMGLRDVHEMNSVKTILAGVINLAAAFLFIAEGKVYWPYAIPMACSCALGGYCGARLALRFPAALVRYLVIAVGVVTVAVYFRPR